MNKKDSQTRQTGKKKLHDRAKVDAETIVECERILGTKRNLSFQIVNELREGIAKLHELSELLPNESEIYPSVLPTFFVDAENALATRIAACLTDVSEKKRDTEHVRSLLRDYKVVRILPQNKCSLSLSDKFRLLQNNYPDSCLRNLIDFVVGNDPNIEAKIITS